MSKVGKAPIPVPEKVEVTIGADSVHAKGPKGELKMDFNPAAVSFEIKDGEIWVERKNDQKSTRAQHGLYRSLLNNCILGVSEGFAKKMEINGVGYRAALAGRTLEMQLGYSHPIKYDLPDGIECVFDEKQKQNIFTLSGIDKQKLGQAAAQIRSFRPPEPYKGKGIKYADEFIARKAGKTATK